MLQHGYLVIENVSGNFICASGTEESKAGESVSPKC